MLIQFLKIFWHMLLCPNMFSVLEKFPTVFRPLYSLFCMIYLYTDFSLRVILDLLDLIIQYHLSLAFSQYFCLFHITQFVSCIDFLISFNYLIFFHWSIFWVVWALLQLFYQFSIFFFFLQFLSGCCYWGLSLYEDRMSYFWKKHVILDFMLFCFLCSDLYNRNLGTLYFSALVDRRILDVWP